MDYVLGRQLHRKRPAGLGLGAVGLVHGPIPNGGKQPAVCRKVAEQQAVVRHHDVRLLRTATRAVDKARRSEVRALAPQAIVACRGDGAARQQAIIYLEAVHVVVARLLHERQQSGQRRSLRLLLSRHQAHMVFLAQDAFYLPEARIMRETLERRERQGTAFRPQLGQSLCQSRQLMVHQLVKQRVRFRGNADCDVVRLSRQRRGHQVRHGFPHACSRFDHEILRRCERAPHRLGHGRLLRARLEPLVQRADKPSLRKRLDYDGVAWKHEFALRIGRYVVRIHLRGALRFGQADPPERFEREPPCGVGCFT